VGFNEGTIVGEPLGPMEGCSDGTMEGVEVDGSIVGTGVGKREGPPVGELVGG
jgi:hypothetical protein